MGSEMQDLLLLAEPVCHEDTQRAQATRDDIAAAPAGLLHPTVCECGLAAGMKQPVAAHSISGAGNRPCALLGTLQTCILPGTTADAVRERLAVGVCVQGAQGAALSVSNSVWISMEYRPLQAGVLQDSCPQETRKGCCWHHCVLPWQRAVACTAAADRQALQQS